MVTDECGLLCSDKHYDHGKIVWVTAIRTGMKRGVTIALDNAIVCVGSGAVAWI